MHGCKSLITRGLYSALSGCGGHSIALPLPFAAATRSGENLERAICEEIYDD
jgi:hypothetical protein